MKTKILIVLLIVGIVLVSGCIQQKPTEELPKGEMPTVEEKPTKTPTTTQPPETPSAEITTADELNNKIVRCIELTDIKKVAEGVPTDKISSYVCIAETIGNVKKLSLCEKITRQSIRDYCIVKLTENLEDVSVCEKLIDQKYRFACIGIAALNTLDVSLCDKIGGAGGKDGCIFNIAMKKRDTSLCQKLTSRTYVDPEYCANFIDRLEKTLKDVLGTCEPRKTPSEQAQCIADVASLAKDVSVCDLTDKLKGAPFDAKTECIFLVAARTGDLSLCEKIRYDKYKGLSKDHCILKMAKERKDLLLCDKLLDSGLKEECIKDSIPSVFALIWHVDIEQMKKEQPLISECERAEGLYQKNECYYNQAINTKNFLICKKIKDDWSYRENCYYNLSMALQNASLCNEIIGRKDECFIKQVAECEKIENSEEKIACYIQVGRALKGVQLYDREKHAGYTGYTICEIIDEELRQNCYEEQRKGCGKIEAENERDGCYQAAAIGLKDSKLCEKITNSARKENCYNQLK